jgi:hypothetical protein
MPDLVTHTAAAYFLSRHQSFERFRVLFYLGTILPDILARPVHILFPQLYSYSIAIHTPIFLLVFTFLFAEFMHPSIKKETLKYLSAGILLHFFLDLFQKHIDAGYYWLFPFSWTSFEIGLFWPELPVSLIPLWCALVVVTEIFIRLRKRRARQSF